MPCRYRFRMCLSHLIYTVRPCLIHTCHAPTMPFFSRPQHSTAISRRPCCVETLRRTAWSEHGMGMASVNQTRPHCVNQMGKTHSKPLAARHGRGTAWARHAMCESALRPPERSPTHILLLQFWGSHSGVVVDSVILRYYAAALDNRFSTFEGHYFTSKRL